MNGNCNDKNERPEAEAMLRSLQQETAQALAGWEFGPELQARVMARIRAQELLPQPRSRRVPVSRRPWIGAAAAAAVVAGVALLTRGEILGDLLHREQAMMEATQQESIPAEARKMPQPSLAAPESSGSRAGQEEYSVAASPDPSGPVPAGAEATAVATAEAGGDREAPPAQAAAAAAVPEEEPVAAAEVQEPPPEPVMGIATVTDAGGGGVGGEAGGPPAEAAPGGAGDAITLQVTDQAGSTMTVKERLAAALDLEYIQGSSGAAGQIRATLTAEGDLPAGLVLTGLVETPAGAVALKPARQVLTEPLTAGSKQSWLFVWDYRLPDGSLAPGGVYTVRVEVRSETDDTPLLQQQLLIRIVR